MITTSASDGNSGTALLLLLLLPLDVWIAFELENSRPLAPELRHWYGK